MVELTLVIVGVLIVVATVVTYPKRLLRFKKQADIAAAEYRVAVTAHWKQQPPSLDATPFTFIIRRIDEATPRALAHVGWYHPFVVWKWQQLQSPDGDLWARVIRYAETREFTI